METPGTAVPAAAAEQASPYDYAGAAAACEAALAASPGNPALLRALARALALMGQYDAAREVLRRRSTGEA